MSSHPASGVVAPWGEPALASGGSALKVLILKPSSLGDVVQALPVLRLIKQHRPEASVFWWIDSRLAGLLEDDPDLDGLALFQRHGFAAPRVWQQYWRTVRWMRARDFDWVIDLQALARSGIFAWLANGRLTIGLDTPREGARAFYDLAVPRGGAGVHAVDWYLRVLDILRVPRGASFVWLPPRPAVASRVRERFGAGETMISLQPGARWLNKRWPVENFAAVMRALAQRRPAARFAILGGAEDRELGARLAALAAPVRCLDLTGQLSLPEMVEWIRATSLMITNDTGPMHVAAAVNTPVVAVFGPTDPRRTGPYGQLAGVCQARLPCVPCLSPRCGNPRSLECLYLIPPAAVVEEACRRI